MKNGPYELIIAPQDYPGKKYRDRYAYEHHVVFWRSNGFVPPKGYEIHHINGKKRDNRIENLGLLSSVIHRKEHGQEKRLRTQFKTECGFCKKPFAIQGADARNRLKKRKFGKLFCSRACGAKHQFQNSVKVERRPIKT